MGRDGRDTRNEPASDQGPRSLAAEFGPFDGRVWINCAHQGPLPGVAARALQEAVRWKTSPHLLTEERFAAVPQRVRQDLGALLNVAAPEVILANSASYGLHLMANGLPLRRGEEVLLMRGDFPSDILPWLALRERGVTVRLLEPRRFVLEADELADHLRPETRVFCTTWVHSFSGWTVDPTALGELCRRNGTWFLLNVSQGLGVRPLDLTRLPVDGVTGVGWKWLCGPYGTGFCWLRPELLEVLEYNQAYWLSLMTAEDLGRVPVDPVLPRDLGACRYDLFATANFFNFHPWAESIELLLRHGIGNVAAWGQGLVDRLTTGLDERCYELLSPRQGPRRSSLVFVTHRDPGRNREVHRALSQAGIDVALRREHLRFSPHVHNTESDIDRALEVLAGLET